MEQATDPEQPTTVAEVLIDSPVPHLDRTFDYLTGEDDVAPGTRVRVPFAGRIADGTVVGLATGSDHEGRLAAIRDRISPIPLLTGEQLDLIDRVADRYAGTRADVVRLALPPRHARTEKAILAKTPAVGDVAPPSDDDTALFDDYASGTPFVQRLATPSPVAAVPRAAAAIMPGGGLPGPADLLAVAAQAAASAGRTALIIVPDYRDLDLLAEAITKRVVTDAFVRLSADQGKAERYKAYLQVLRGTARIVIGTRAAMFAPVENIGLLAVLEDGDDLLAEPRAPYPHALDVMLLRSAGTSSPLLVAGHSRSTDVQRLVENHYLVDMQPARRIVRARAPQIARPDPSRPDDGGRLPETAFRVTRSGLGMQKNPKHPPGPVLVQVPRAGYVPLLTCQGCRRAARCAECHGPLEQRGGDRPANCRWCGRQIREFECPHCLDRRLRRGVIGAGRTGDELARAFPGIALVRSSGDHVLAAVSSAPAIVVATVGAEPVADGGYAAALLLDGRALISLPGLRAGEQALRRWLAAAALVRPAADGGAVFIDADEERTVGALARWDPVGYAERELAERRELQLPPVRRIAALTGTAAAVGSVLDDADLPGDVTTVGPTPVDGAEESRALIFFGYDQAHVSRSLRSAITKRSANRRPGKVRARVDDTGSLD